MAQLSLPEIRSAIENQLKQCPSLNKVFKYGEKDIDLANSPWAELILERVTGRNIRQTDFAPLGMSGYEIEWSLVLAVDLGKGYREAQEEMDQVISDVRWQFDENQMPVDPVSGFVVDEVALSQLPVQLMRKDVVPCLCASGTLTTYITILR